MKTMDGLALGICVLSATGCITDKAWTARPVRLNVGMSERHLSSPPPVTANPYGVAGSGNAERTTSPTGGEVNPNAEAPSNATVGAAQFTVATPYHTYVGGAVETGTLGRSGSSIAAVYGVLGAEVTSRIGSLAAEVAYGWQTMRADIYSQDIDGRIFEPRLRGELWLSPQFTLGATIGGMPDTNNGNTAWMAGVYLGVHSNLFDIWGQKGLPTSAASEPTGPAPAAVEPLQY